MLIGKADEVKHRSAAPRQAHKCSTKVTIFWEKEKMDNDLPNTTAMKLAAMIAIADLGHGMLYSRDRLQDCGTAAAAGLETGNKHPKMYASLAITIMKKNGAIVQDGNEYRLGALCIPSESRRDEFLAMWRRYDEKVSNERKQNGKQRDKKDEENKKMKNKMNAPDAAEEALRYWSEPVTLDDLVLLMSEMGLWSSTALTPAATVSSAIYKDMQKKGPSGRFKKEGKLYLLNEWSQGRASKTNGRASKRNRPAPRTPRAPRPPKVYRRDNPLDTAKLLAIRIDGKTVKGDVATLRRLLNIGDDDDS